MLSLNSFAGGISIEPLTGIAMETLFSIKLSNDSSATNTILEIQKVDDDVVWLFANTDLVSLKFPSGNFFLKLLSSVRMNLKINC